MSIPHGDRNHGMRLLIGSSVPPSEAPSGTDAGTEFSIAVGEELWLYRTDDTLLLHLYRVTPLAG